MLGTVPSVDWPITRAHGHDFSRALLDGTQVVFVQVSGTTASLSAEVVGEQRDDHPAGDACGRNARYLSGLHSSLHGDLGL